MANESSKSFITLQSNKPTKSLEDAPPEIRNYILQLESLLIDSTAYEDFYNEENKKNLDLETTLFELEMQMIDCKTQIRELTEENKRLEKENETLKQEVGKQGIKVPSCTSTERLNRRINIIEKDANSASESIENGANCILVKGAPNRLYECDPKQAVIFLGDLMGFRLTEIDIRKIIVKERKFYERQNLKPDKLIYVVEFCNSELKVNFLKNKEKLKVHSNTKDVEITDYVSEDVYNLYQYAKTLKSVGYQSVYWRNNSVYVKKTRGTTSHPILILSTNQVDLLKQLK